MSKKNLYHLLCYDIADPKRLAKVHRHIKTHAIPVQYSVYLISLTPHKREELLKALNHLINPREDDIRLYPLPNTPHWSNWGKPILPDGLNLSSPLPSNII